MTTSGSYTITVTAQNLIEAAMQALGLLASGESSTTAEQTDAIRVLNYWILQMKGRKNGFSKGLKMWQRETAELTLTATATYLLKPSGGALAIQIPEEILSASLRTSADIDTPMSEMTREEYDAISNKAATGDPTRYLYERKLTDGTLILDRVPSDTTKTIFFTYRQPIEIVSAAANNLDWPDYWHRAAVYALSRELAPIFGAMKNFQVVSGFYAEAMALVDSFEPETLNLYFEPGRS